MDSINKDKKRIEICLQEFMWIIWRWLLCLDKPIFVAYITTLAIYVLEEKSYADISLAQNGII